MMTDYAGKNVLVLGAARQGLAVARYLNGLGASVTMNDRRPAVELAAARESLSDLDLRWELGSHPLSLLDGTDLVILSGAIPHTLPLVIEARQRGIPLSNDTQIFLEAVPCKWIGITGSAGKTTTTTLVGRMAEAGKREGQRVWVGGNIGHPLLAELNEMQPDDLVILELSSFQLELTTFSPAVGAILNITPNHLDRHGTMEAYAAAKLNLLAYQGADDIAVLNHEDLLSWHARHSLPSQVQAFGFDRLTGLEQQVYQHNDQIVAEENGLVTPLLPMSDIALRGRHNVGNVIAACAIAQAADFDSAAMRAGVSGFKGVHHRLELVRSHNGVSWYNDSICTAPERVIAAIQSFDEPIVLLLGGRDKNLPWDDLAKLVHQRVKHVVLFGEAAPIINSALRQSPAESHLQTLTSAEHLVDALEIARKLSEPGDVVLLSPGGTSFDEFYDFEQRGNVFTAWVEALP